MIVLKVGGSLFDHPGLGPGLRAYLDALAPAAVTLVPGGGAVADAVRRLDQVHGLGEEAAHRLALRSMAITAGFVAHLLDTHPPRVRPPVLDAHAFFARDDGRDGSLPHTWAVTSDSIAARVAAVAGASRLVLLKSVSLPPNTPWAEAAERGWVDAHFPLAAAALHCPAEAVDFRAWMDGRGYGP